jgi:hypothetical protein
VPELPRTTVSRVKREAQATNSQLHVQSVRAIRERAAGASVRMDSSRRSGLLQPGGYAGAAELSMMQRRLELGATLQTAALDSLITVRDGGGAGIGVGSGAVGSVALHTHGAQHSV